MEMSRHLNLIKSDFEQVEKRVLPRFPFCFLTFKSGHNESLVFEVKDISNTGMQLALKEGEHGVREGQNLHGFLHWKGSELEIQGQVKWVSKMRMGVEFSSAQSIREAVDKFLGPENIAKYLKPVHDMEYTNDLPANLKYWLRADGPVEVFIWQHSDGELSKFQILVMENFVEWQDGEGLKTARVLSKRDIDTPLLTEDEFVFKMDDHLDEAKIQLARELVNAIPENVLSVEVLQFLQLKIRE